VFLSPLSCCVTVSLFLSISLSVSPIACDKDILYYRRPSKIFFNIGVLLTQELRVKRKRMCFLFTVAKKATKTELAYESHTANFRVSSITPQYTHSKSESHSLQVGVSNPIETSRSESELLRHTSETRSSSHARRKVAKQTPDRFMVDTSWLMSMVDTFMVDTSCLIVSWLTLSWLTLHAHIVSWLTLHQKHSTQWLTLHQKHSTHGSVSYVQRHTSETRSSSHARRKVAKQTPDHTNSGMKVKGQSRTADLSELTSEVKADRSG
jgi:hypothetical protein